MAITKEKQHQLAGRQKRGNALPKSSGYLALAVIASLLLSFTVIGGAMSPAEAAKKGPNHNADTAPSTSDIADNVAIPEPEQQQPSPDKIASKVLAADDKDTVTEGEIQTVYIAVIADHKPVQNATVSATVFFGKSVEKKFTGITQDDGTVSFTWMIEKHSKTGLIGMDIKAEPEGYDTGYGSLVFRYRA